MGVDLANPAVAEQQAGAGAFFKSLSKTFGGVRQDAEAPTERFFRIAGKNICLRFAGDALVPALTPALAHLTTDPVAKPDLSVGIWDARSTGVKLPRPPWSGAVYGPRGDVRGYNDARFKTAFHFGAGALSMFDAASNRAVYCTRDASGLPSYERGSPLRTIFHWALRNHGLQLAHAAAVGKPEGGVLLAGKGGSGKSTTALRCLQSDLLYASDDYCVLDPVQNYVYSLYNTAKVDADNVERVAFLRSAISNPEYLAQQKALMFLHQHYPERLIGGFPIRAVLLPRTTGRPNTTVTAATANEAVSALALSTMRQLPGADHGSIQIIARVAEQVPCFHLELGTDLVQIPKVLSDVIGRGGL